MNTVARSPNRTVPHRGLTLVELMVALALGLMLCIALVVVQRVQARQSARSSDIALLGSEVRAAMDLITHDLSGAGFLYGVGRLPCDALMTYNAATAAGSAVRLPVDGLAAAAGVQLPYGTAITLNYPAAASGTPSAVIGITTASGASNFNDLTAPIVAAQPAASAPTPLTTGSINVVGTTGLTQGHSALMAVTVGTAPTLRQACLRVPLTVVTNPTTVSSSGALMPPNFYAGFAALVASAGLPGTLTDAEINSTGRLTDLGNPASPALTTTVFYVDGAANPWPTLMRATYSALDDTLIGTPQPIAAGVVSLQLLFGVDPGGTNSVTAYETGAQLAANGHQTAVLSVRVALVARSLYPDADFTNTTASVAVPGGFANVPIPAAYANYRYVVQQTEVALRNSRWLRN